MHQASQFPQDVPLASIEKRQVPDPPHLGSAPYLTFWPVLRLALLAPCESFLLYLAQVQDSAYERVVVCLVRAHGERQRVEMPRGLRCLLAQAVEAGEETGNGLEGKDLEDLCPYQVLIELEDVSKESIRVLEVWETRTRRNMAHSLVHAASNMSMEGGMMVQ